MSSKTTEKFPAPLVPDREPWDVIEEDQSSPPAAEPMATSAQKIELLKLGFTAADLEKWTEARARDWLRIPGQTERGKELPARTAAVILKTGDAPRAVRRIKQILIEDSARPNCPASDKIFRRGSELVHLSRNELSAEDRERGRVDGGPARDDDYHVADDLLIRSADPLWFCDRAERTIAFYRLNREQEKIPAEPSMKLLQTVGAIITTTDFPPLKGTTETPTLRADYSLLTAPGYDRKTGLFYDPGRAEFPDIPATPTKVDAYRALELFTGERGILHDFPFTDGPAEPKGLSKAVALAMLLTSVVRRTMPTAPMFAIDAYEAQSGKTLLGRIAGALATGREIAVRPWQSDEYQRRNDLAMALETGDPVLVYDNLGPDAPLAGDSFNAAITAPIYATRRLGSNSAKDALQVFTNALLIATGNHMVVNGDMAEGRVLITRIIPGVPYAQRSFIYRDLLAHVIRNRPQLVAAALTILRGYAVAADKREQTKFRHREWGDLVAGAVAWLGLPDPCLAEHRSKGTDAVREVQENVVRAWAKALGSEWLDVNTIIKRPEIAELIASDREVTIAKLTYKEATPFLRDMIGVDRLGLKVEHQPGDGNHRPARWRLIETNPNNKGARLAEFTRQAEAEQDFAEPIDD